MIEQVREAAIAHEAVTHEIECYGNAAAEQQGNHLAAIQPEQSGGGPEHGPEQQAVTAGISSHYAAGNGARDVRVTLRSKQKEREQRSKRHQAPLKEKRIAERESRTFPADRRARDEHDQDAIRWREFAIAKDGTGEYQPA